MAHHATYRSTVDIVGPHSILHSLVFIDYKHHRMCMLLIYTAVRLISQPHMGVCR